MDNLLVYGAWYIYTGKYCSVCVNRLNDLALFARGHDDVNCGEHSFPICVLPVRSLCK